MDHRQRMWAGLMLAATAASCTAILGIDGDYHDATSGSGGTSGGAGGGTSHASGSTGGSSTTSSSSSHASGSGGGSSTTSSSSASASNGSGGGSSGNGGGGGGTSGPGGSSSISGGSGGAGGSGATSSNATASNATTSSSGTGGAQPTFLGGPCTVTPDGTSVEVFARGSDRRIYRRANDGTNWGNWASLPALDGAGINALSDLDCSANATTIHIVATVTNPLGAYMHAIGFGTVYNPFFRELSNDSFSPSPSITTVAGSNTYRIAALKQGVPVFYEIGSSAMPQMLSTPMTGTITYPFTGTDLAWQGFAADDITYLVAFDASGSLAVNRYVVSASPPYWDTPTLIAPPPSTTAYALSPTVCTASVMGNYYLHVAAVAGGKLWHSVQSSADFSPWEQIGDDAASAPDCTATTQDGTVHVVTLSSTGTVLDVHGSTGSWTVTDLGAY